MVDFHSHILPGIDDGSEDVEMSLAMLSESKRQGVDIIFATPHFYADEDDPESFLYNRNESFELLKEELDDSVDYPEIILGAEILYFPGMSVAEELRELRMGDTPYLLIEPPLMPWSDMMLDEIAETGKNLELIPVIAHIDRYMRILRDNSLIDRARERDILIQVNTGYFLRRESFRQAVQDLKSGRIHFLGSDCHGVEERVQNMGVAAEEIVYAGYEREFSAFNDRVYARIGRA